MLSRLTSFVSTIVLGLLARGTLFGKMVFSGERSGGATPLPSSDERVQPALFKAASPSMALPSHYSFNLHDSVVLLLK
jgi:hypothetical protein